MRARTLLTIACAATALGTAVPSASAQGPNTGGAAYGPDDPALTATVPGDKAVLQDNGLAAAPELAPEPVKEAIWAANRLVGKPYRYGGGHAKVEDTGYDCSGTISYALIHGGLLKRPLDSTSFMRWGGKGRGRWISVYANRGHAFVVIAGLRLDTSAAGDPEGGKGPRWRPALRKTRGFTVRRAVGL